MKPIQPYPPAAPPEPSPASALYLISAAANLLRMASASLFAWVSSRDVALALPGIRLVTRRGSKLLSSSLGLGTSRARGRRHAAALAR
jgi:hypothetical protein